MSQHNTIQKKTNDHALDRVPDGERHNWLDLSWNTAGIVTALVALYIGSLVTFTAGVKIAVTAGLIVTVIGGLLGWGLGHIAYKSGLSSTVMARYYGFGLKGSVIASFLFAFMIIGFIALENVLLYKGFLFFFSLEDTLTHRIIVFSVLTTTWVLLTAYGFETVTRFSSLMLISFGLVLIYMLVTIVTSSDKTLEDVLTFGTQLSANALKNMGISSSYDKFVFSVNILIGSAGALALIDADLGRYSRSSRDIGIASFIGIFFMDILMLLAGGIIMYAGLSSLIEYYTEVDGVSREAAVQLAIDSPDRIAAAFIVFGGVVGALLMVVAQSKTQVLNTYSSSLSLANLFDAIFSWQPGRLVFVILANLLSLLFLYQEVMHWLHAFLVILGILITCFSGIILADYFIVRPMLGHQDTAEYGVDYVNWAGVISVVVGYWLAHHVLNPWVTIEFFTSLGVSFFVYPLLRIYVLKPAYSSSLAGCEEITALSAKN